MRMTDVAEAAGVSVATVSRVLSRSRPVNAELRDRILRVVDELNYEPHAVARSLRRASTQTIGIVVPAIDNPFFPRLIQAAEQALATHDLALIIVSGTDDPEVEAVRVDNLLGRRIDGLLICATASAASGPTVRRAASRVPVVQFDQRTDGSDAPFLGIDDGAGVALVVDHLRAQGVSTIGHIGAGRDNWSARQRRAAFVAETDRHGLTGVTTEAGSFSRDHGRRTARELMARRPDVEAVVCDNDLIASGVLDAAQEAGRNVPRDLLVTGFDDIDVATVCRPRLTTVAQPFDDLMERSVAALLAQSTGGPVEPEPLLPVRLVVRESSVHP